MRFVRAFTGLASVILAVIGAAPVDATVSEDMAAAQAAAQQCDYVAARQRQETALAEATREWPAGHEGFFILHQSLAQWNNQAFDYAAAEEHARAALALAMQIHGKKHLTTGLAELELAHALIGRRQFDDASKLIEDARSLFEPDGPDAIRLAVVLLTSNLEFARGRPGAGLRAAEQAAVLATDNAQLASSAWLPIAEARRRMLNLDGAKDALQRSEAAIAASGTPGEQRRVVLSKAALTSDQGNLTEALTLLDQATALPLSPCDPLGNVDAQYLRGEIHLLRREISEAREAFGAAIAGIEQLGIQRSPRYGEALAGLAKTVGLAGKLADSNRLFDAAVAAFTQSFGGTTSVQALVRLDQAYILSTAGRSDLALPIAEEGSRLIDRSSDGSPLDQAYAAATLGHTFKDAGRYPEAEAELLRAMSRFEAVRGRDSFDLAPGLLSLGEVKLVQNKPADAEQYLLRSLEVQQKGGWTGAQAVGVTRARLAAAYADQGMRSEALEQSEKAIAVLRDRVALGEDMPWADAEAERRRARAIIDEEFTLLSGEAGAPTASPRLIDRVLAAGQLGASLKTGAAIAQMAARFSIRNDELAELIRRRQDLVARWKAVQDMAVSRLASFVPTTSASNGDEIGSARDDAARISHELSVVNNRIEMKYRSASLVLNSPVASREQIGRVIRPREAVVATFVGEETTFVVIFTAEASRWYAVPIRRQELSQKVRAIRATLDSKLWIDKVPPRFPAQIAYELYDKLLGPGADMLDGMLKIVVVADGPLMSLPFSILLTQPWDINGQGAPAYSDAPWLVRRHALESAPSLAAFVLLREVQRPRARKMSFLGIGNPVLARQQDVSISASTSGAEPSVSMLARLSALKLSPLPDTGVELSAIADLVGRDQSTLLTDTKATESLVRRSDTGRYSIIAFATHGLVAGDLTGYDEPVLVLTQPLHPTEDDDGLLSASEVAQLRLNADFVILSACNTAAGDGSPEAEPFTGLVKAFFYAGARSILATHWPVDSNAAATLSASLVRNYGHGMGRAEAWQAAQLEMIGNEDGTTRTHPVFWAAFELVGSE